MKYDLKQLLVTVQEIEEKAASLYKTLSMKSSGKPKSLFERLAKEELAHKKLYKKIIEFLPLSGYVNFSEEDADYIELLVSTNIFNNIDLRKYLAKSDALYVAEKIEKDSIMLYLEIMSLYPALKDSPMKRIVKEEKQHLKEVVNLQLNESFTHLHL